MHESVMKLVVFDLSFSPGLTDAGRRAVFRAVRGQRLRVPVLIG